MADDGRQPGVLRHAASRLERREEPLGQPPGGRMPEPNVSRENGIDPEHEALLASSAGGNGTVSPTRFAPGCRKLTARKPRLLLQVSFYLFEAAALGLRHQGADKDEGHDPHHSVPQERDTRSDGCQKAGKRLGNCEVGYPM